MSLKTTPTVSFGVSRHDPRKDANQKTGIYCLNNSKKYKSSNNRFCSITFNVTEGNKEIGIKIPSTFIPIELTAYASRKAILESNSFLDIARKGIVICISEEEFEERMSDPDAQEEKERLLSLSMGHVESMSSEVEQEDIEDDVENTSIIDVILHEESLTGDEKTRSDGELYSMFKMNIEDFKKADFEKVIKKVKNPNIIRLAKELLEKKK